MNTVTTLASNMILLGIILSFILAGFWKKVNVYDAFIEGAKEGFTTAVKIIPYLVAILVGIGVFRASGAMDMVIQGVSWSVEQCGLNADFVGAYLRHHETAVGKWCTRHDAGGDEELWS